jgi:ABC-type uncharacterized transport system permease subunit
LPSIQRLELITMRLVLVGFVLLTIGLTAGSQMPRHEGESYFSDIKVIWSMLIWLVFLESLVSHKIFGRSSRRFAAGVIMAFCFLLLTFWITNLLSPLHQNQNPHPSPTNSVPSAVSVLPVTRHFSLVTR